jgi:uncharacterized protein YidB (DUF937 family)
MGILEDLLASASQPQGGMGDMGGVRRQPRQAPATAQAGGGGLGNVMMALLPVVLAMLANRGGGAPAGRNPGGGGLGDILGQVLGGGAAPRGGGGMGDILGQILAGGGGGGGGIGGLGGLLEQFQRAGFGEQAGSWVGPGQNLPISPDVIGQIFGRDGLAAIARQAGVSEREASEGLSQLLPEVVDRVTPNGEVPDLDQLTASVADLSRRFGLA